MTDWLSESQLVNNISSDLLQPKQEYYSEDAYSICDLYLGLSIEQHPKLRMKHFQQYNRYEEKIYGVLVDFR